MMRKLLFSLVAIFLVCGLAVAGEHEVVTATADVGDDGVQRVVVVGGEYYFKPNRIILKVNVPTELLVSKEPGFVPHNIAMDAPDAGMSFDLDFGKEGEIVAFTPTKTGTYEFYCSKKLLFFKSHKEKGMHGVIEVVE